MKKHLYIIIEAILSVMVLILFVIRCIIEFNIVIVAFALIGSLYFIYKIITGVKLFISNFFMPGENGTVP